MKNVVWGGMWYSLAPMKSFVWRDVGPWRQGIQGVPAHGGSGHMLQWRQRPCAAADDSENLRSRPTTKGMILAAVQHSRKAAARWRPTFVYYPNNHDFKSFVWGEFV